MSIHDLPSEVLELLGRLRQQTGSTEEQQLLDFASDAILFIVSTGQRYAFEDYRKHLDADEPPPVVAAFNTREEAESWLKEHPEPPEGAKVLVGDQYHKVIYFREKGHRRLLPWPSIEYYIKDITRDGIPPAVAVFDTRAQAEAWLTAQVEPPAHAFILIAGEPHLTVYHRNVGHRAIYSIAMAHKLAHLQPPDGSKPQ